MQKARRHPKAPTACKRMVSGSISLLCSRFFSPFLHSTSSLSVTWEYLALPDGAGRFPHGVSDRAVLRILTQCLFLPVRDYHPILWYFPILFQLLNIATTVLQPHICRNKHGLGSFHFARHYSGNHYCFLFLRLLRCFSSAGLPPIG